MLLEFQADNYKNFANGFTFSMKPNLAHKDLPYSIQTAEAAGQKYQALSSGIILGPNASGKSNLIGAMDTFKQIVLRGNIEDFDSTGKLSNPNYAGSFLELIPNRYLGTPKPVSFEIEFVKDNMHFDYRFSADIGTFMDVRYDREILTESLRVNQGVVFERERSEYTFGKIDKIPAVIWGDEVKNRKARAEVAAEMAAMAQPTDLFLMNGFKTSVSPKLARTIQEWLNSNFIVLCDSQTARFQPLAASRDEKGFHEDKLLTKVVSLLSPNTDAAGYSFDSNGQPHLHVALMNTTGDIPPGEFPAEFYESYGTIRFLNIFPIIVNAIKKGDTLVMDEFDASLHPALSQALISLFHDDEVNTNGAQLVIATHNALHMSGSLYRRDEIHLVDSDRKTHSSEHYTLADFKTHGANSVRKDEAYMRKYLHEAYGAFPDIDMDSLIDWALHDGHLAASAAPPASKGDSDVHGMASIA